jgi:hypothetical protein
MSMQPECIVYKSMVAATHKHVALNRVGRRVVFARNGKAFLGGWQVSSFKESYIRR